VGELTKKLEIDEWGIIQTSIYLCGTHALAWSTTPRCWPRAASRQHADPGRGECDDSDLADSRTVTATT